MFALDTASLKFSCYIVTVFSQRVQLQLQARHVCCHLKPVPVSKTSPESLFSHFNYFSNLSGGAVAEEAGLWLTCKQLSRFRSLCMGVSHQLFFLGTSNMKMPYLCSFNLIMHGLSSKIGIQIKLEWKLNLVDFSWCSRNMYFRCPTSTLKFVQFFILNKTVQNTLLVCPKNAF